MITDQRLLLLFNTSSLRSMPVQRLSAHSSGLAELPLMQIDKVVIKYRKIKY